MYDKWTDMHEFSTIQEKFQPSLISTLKMVSVSIITITPTNWDNRHSSQNTLANNNCIAYLRKTLYLTPKGPHRCLRVKPGKGGKGGPITGRGSGPRGQHDGGMWHAIMKLAWPSSCGRDPRPSWPCHTSKMVHVGCTSIWLRSFGWRRD